MKYKIGDKVVFKSQPYKQYAWKLNDYEVYEIRSCAFATENSDDYKMNTFYYSVKDKKGTETSWFEHDDFITIKKYRKLKLKKIIKNYGNKGI
jgi:hypothetical protein